MNNNIFPLLAVTLSAGLTACGGGGGSDAKDNVVRNVFAVGDVFNLVEDEGPVTGDVSINDRGDGLTFSLADGEAVQNGTLEFNSDGTFTYTPNPDFFGTDSVTYVATQASTGDTATASLVFEVENDFETIEDYGWEVVWSDDFDGESLNETLWEGVNVAVSDGHLVLFSQGRSSEERESKVTSLNSVMYGRVEAGVMLTAGTGVSAVFGLLPFADLYEGSNAVSALEYGREGLIAGAHYGLGLRNGLAFNSAVTSAVAEQYQTFAVEWGTQEIRWYVNDEHVHTVNLLNTWAYTLSGEEVVVDNDGPFNQEMNVVAAFEDHSDEPVELLIDYITVWQCNEAVAPDVVECASNVERKISSAASDRIESVGDVTTDFYVNGLEEIAWHHTDQVIELDFGNWNEPTIQEVDLGPERSNVIDVQHPSEANVAITAPGVALVGRDHVLNFDMYIKGGTDTEVFAIKMETGWPYLGAVEWPLDELEAGKWVSYSIPVSDFLDNPFIAPDWLNWIPGVSPGDPLPLDPSNVGSLLLVEFYGAAHIQLANINMSCVSNEHCIQAPLAVQEESDAGGPIHIEAEDYDAESGTQLEDTADVGGGQNVGWTDPGDYLEYKVNIPFDGEYVLEYRMASDLGSDGFTTTIGGVQVDSQEMPATGGWQEWVTQTGTATLTAGEQTMRIDFIGGAVNLNWIKIIPPFSLHIEAEDYDAESGTQLEGTTDEGGGENVGWTDPGDYLEYKINIPRDGTYTIEYRLASDLGSDGFTTTVGGVQVDAQSLAATGGWQSWVTQSSEVALVAGEQTLRIDFIGGAVNLNWIRISE